MSKEENTVVTTEISGEIGLISLNSPPVNALGTALRQQLVAAVEQLTADQRVRVVVIYSAGRLFCAGADIREFDKPPVAPRLPDVLNLIEQNPKPVVAVLHGAALGGGLELALSCHARVGLPDVRLGLTEVTLGLLPGAGGTQRLPRLAPLNKAIDIITTGRHLMATEAHAVGILDYLDEGSSREAALRAGAAVLDGTLITRRTGEITVDIDSQAIEDALKQLRKKRPVLAAPIKAVEAISMADRPLAEGLAAERALFLELMESPDRQGLIHAFNAERAVKHVPEACATPRRIETAAVIGGGTMGVGIATSLLQAGIPVTLIEMTPERVESAQKAVMKNLDGAVHRGKISADARERLLATLTVTTELERLASVDLVVEAVFEDIAVKSDLFRKLDAICKSGAILGTNTSYLDVNAIAAATLRPQDVIGLHFFSPAHIMRLLEVVVADRTAPEVVATALDLATRMKKIAVRSGVCDGFIGNRILAHYRKVADYMLFDGADFVQIDGALEDFGFAMGPFAVADLAGLDIGWATRKRKAPTRPQEERYIPVADQICEAGWFGRKSGRGYYVYEGNAARQPNTEILTIIDTERSLAGVIPRVFSNEEIVARYMTAMISEAARVVEEGIALRPIDVDAVFLFGYGFPRHLGGPLNYADRIGHKILVERIETYAKEDPYYWQVPALLRELADENRNFSDLN